jgi:hypothetical protein
MPRTMDTTIRTMMMAEKIFVFFLFTVTILHYVCKNKVYFIWPWVRMIRSIILEA